MADPKKDLGGDQDIAECIIQNASSMNDFLDDSGQEQAPIAVDSHLATGTVVVNVDERANPFMMIPVGVIIVVGGRVKTRASKKRVALQEATESSLSEDT